ncbi:MAG: DUF1570 domain-containing protein [Planctomycetes bacterium]|nr:DUF1570 domain-containing protein [Planctomycetota bacterium]
MYFKKRLIVFISSIIFLSGILTAFPEEGAPQPFALYKEKLQALGPKDVDGHYNLALWCRDQGLMIEMRARLRWAVRLKPEHKNARELLGDIKENGIWFSKETAALEKKNGLIKYNEIWMLDGTGRKLKYTADKAELDKRKDWNEAWLLRTEHYVVRTNTDPDAAFKIGTTMESVYNTFFDIFDYDVMLNEPAEPLPVNIYKDQNDFTRAAVEILKGGNIAGDAFYFTGFGVNAYVGDTLYQNLYHEGCHQLVDVCMGIEPLAPLTMWFYEGLGEYFEYSREAADNRIKPGGASAELGSLKGFVNGDQHIPFDRFLSLNQNQYMMSDVAYPQGWGVVHFLMEYQKGRYRTKFLAYLNDCKTGAGMEKFLKAMEGVTLIQLEKEWKEYILNLR